MRNDYNGTLAHHGILGQKWGHQNGPPYPLDAKDHSSSEQKAGWRASLKAKSEAKKKDKQRKANLEKARKARDEKAKQEKLEKEFEEKKEKILKSGKASEVAKYKGQMTNQQLSDALNRIRWEQQLDQMSAAEQKSNFDKIDSYMNKAKTVKNWVDAGMDIYDTFATLYNFAHPEDQKRYIKKGNKEKKKNDDD